MWLCTHVLFFSFLKCRFDEVNDSGLEEPEGYGDIALHLTRRSPGDNVPVRAPRASGGGEEQTRRDFQTYERNKFRRKKNVTFMWYSNDMFQYMFLHMNLLRS